MDQAGGPWIPDQKHTLPILVHGVVHDTLDFCRSILQVELNSATDNPMILAHRDCTIRYYKDWSVDPRIETILVVVIFMASIRQRRWIYWQLVFMKWHQYLKGELNVFAIRNRLAKAKIVCQLFLLHWVSRLFWNFEIFEISKFLIILEIFI